MGIILQSHPWLLRRHCTLVLVGAMQLLYNISVVSMNRCCLLMIAAAGLIFFAHFTPAQSPSPKPKAPINSSGKTAKSEATVEAERLAKERRVQARSLLISLASDARSFRDQT